MMRPHRENNHIQVFGCTSPTYFLLILIGYSKGLVLIIFRDFTLFQQLIPLHPEDKQK